MIQLSDLPPLSRPDVYCTWPPKTLPRYLVDAWYVRRTLAMHEDRAEYERLRDAAHIAVTTAVQRNALPRARSHGKCKDCDKPAQCYDHRDYREPLKVDAVCLGCNNRRGRALPFPKLPRRFYKARSETAAKPGPKPRHAKSVFPLPIWKAEVML